MFWYILLMQSAWAAGRVLTDESLGMDIRMSII
jgi:hypothetical protein